MYFLRNWKFWLGLAKDAQASFSDNYICCCSSKLGVGCAPTRFTFDWWWVQQSMKNNYPRLNLSPRSFLDGGSNIEAMSVKYCVKNGIFCRVFAIIWATLRGATILRDFTRCWKNCLAGESHDQVNWSYALLLPNRCHSHPPHSRTLLYNSGNL